MTSVLPSSSLGDRLGFVGRLGELDAAGFAAAAGVNLRLDDRRWAAQALGNVVRLPAAVNATSPRGTGTPYLARTALA